MLSVKKKYRSSMVLLLSLLLEASPFLSIVLVFLLIVSGVLPVAILIMTGRIVQAANVLMHSGLGAGVTTIVVPLLVIAALFAGQQIASPVSRTVTQNLGLKLSLLVRERILDATLSPEGVAHLEEPQTANDILLAAGVEGRAFAPTQMVSALYAMAGTRITGIASALLLIVYHPWVPFLLMVSWSIIPFWIRRQTLTQMKRTESATPSLRTADYSRDLLMRQEAAKEVRLFGLPQWLLSRFTESRRQGLSEIWKERGKRRWLYVPYLLVPMAASALVLTLLSRSMLAGTISLSAFTVYALAVVGAKETGRTMAWWTRGLYGAGSLVHAVGLKEKTVIGDLLQSVPAAQAHERSFPRRELRFERVTFSYGKGERPVLEGLDLTIPVGRSLAIVGHNGAGKTTLIKLLCRLYDPVDGRITADQEDLRSFAPPEWRKRLGVVFQDFVHYELPALDNVGLGSLGLEYDRAALARAAARAGASNLIDSLPAGWDTVLSRAYAGGVELSGGQWQRVALSRAFAAVEGGAKLLILDEPTANLDVRAEAALFERFLELTRGLTTILITHRLSSVVHADEICVLDHGRVAEQGSHAELLSRGGIYSEMFRLQAANFKKADQ